jgi:hypothetical protein
MRIFLAAIALLIAAQAASAGTATLTGEVIDLQCEMKDPGNRGSSHADCALSCAKRGARLGLLTDDAVYTITGEYTRENNRRLIEFVARTVRASGEVTERDGQKLLDLNAIEIAK